MPITAVGESQEFGYSGNVEEYVVPITGLYQLEVWGASVPAYNGAAYSHCAVGGSRKAGYGKGYIELKKGEVIYIVCGGQPKYPTSALANGTHTYAGGYNGGGSGSFTVKTNGGGGVASLGGGGATHIAKRTGLLSKLFEYKEDVLIVAGGAGGSYCDYGFYQPDYKGKATAYVGGSGGGEIGGTGAGASTSFGTGGTQSKAGTNGIVSGAAGGFGYGGSPGGGGGYYGGGATNANSYSGGSAGGGSGYVGGVPEITYKGETYSPVLKNDVNVGTGRALITLIAKGIPTIYIVEEGVVKTISGIAIGGVEFSSIHIEE